MSATASQTNATQNSAVAMSQASVKPRPEPVDGIYPGSDASRMTATQIGGVAYYVKTLIGEGKHEQALRYAKGKGFVSVEVLLNRGNPNRGKWPEHCRAEVWSHCLNKRLMVVKLPDRRKASCWRGRSRNPIGARIFVKLLSATGDPIYETTLEEPVSEVV